MTEREQRLVRYVEIFAGEMDPWGRRGGRSGVARKTAESVPWRAARSRACGRSGPPRPVSTSPMALPASLPKNQAASTASALLDEPGHDQRATREQNGDDRLAQRLCTLEDRLRKDALPSGKIEMRAAGRLAAHARRFTQAQQDGIRVRAQLERLRDARQILAVDVDARRVQHLRLGAASAEALRPRRHGRRARRHPTRGRASRPLHRPTDRRRPSALPDRAAAKRSLSFFSITRARAATSRARRRRAARAAALAARRRAGTGHRKVPACSLSVKHPADGRIDRPRALTQPRSNAIGKPRR